MLYHFVFDIFFCITFDTLSGFAHLDSKWAFFQCSKCSLKMSDSLDLIHIIYFLKISQNYFPGKKKKCVDDFITAFILKRTKIQRQS